MKKLEIVRKVLIDERNELMAKLFKDGYSYSDIAFIFNVAHTTVLRILKK